MSSRFLLVCSVAAMLASPAAVLAQSGRTDAQIKADVESKLRSDQALEGLSIGVEVNNGVVTLTGNAASDDQLTTAENDISSIQGITQIQDNINVAANTSAPQGTAPAGTQNEAQSSAQNAQPPAGAQNDSGNNNMDQPQPNYNQGYNQQQPPPNGNYGNNQPPPPPSMNNNYGPGNGNGPGGYGADYGAMRRPMRFAAGGVAVTLPPNTVMNVRVLEPVTGGQTPVNTFVKGVVARDVVGGEGVVLPRGAPVTLQVVESKAAGHYRGGAILAVKLSNLTLGNQAYPLISDTWGEKTPGKGGNTAGGAVGGAAFGALLGAIAGGGPGAAIGAGAGAVVGGTASGATPRPMAYIPAEGVVTFRLTAPLTITTVSPEAARALEASAPVMAPVQRRYPPPYPGYYRPYPYPYPAPPPPPSPY